MTEQAYLRAERPHELVGSGLTWIDLPRPGSADIHGLAERFGWHPLAVEDVLSRRQRPKVDAYDDHLFAVLHFPAYDRAARRLNAAELDLFLGRDYLVTIPSVELPPLSRLFGRSADAGSQSRLLTQSPGRLLYELLDDLYDYCFPIVDRIAIELDEIDEEIGTLEAARHLVRDIHRVKQEIISYRKIIKPQRPTLRQLERQVELLLPDELELYFDDLVDAGERIWDLLDNYKEVVEALEDTNESLISHQQSDILYVLTIFSVVMLPLTFLSGFFGMNVHFPGFNSYEDFLAVCVLMAIAVVGMLLFFRWKRWL